jgi:enoyl-[acyl-carrier protein] reductase I
VNTLAARGVAHFRELLRITAERAAMKRPIEVEEVGRACVYLASPLSTGTTGETLYVDAGFSIMA